MKHLLLLRHAKSSWSDSTLRDFYRPLNDRGRDAAPRMGRVIGEQTPQRPTFVLSSPAVRTRETTELVLAAAQLEINVIFDERIYEATYRRLLDVLDEVQNSHESVLLIGHNPGLENLLAHLTGDEREMPTAALAVVALDIETWNEIRQAQGRLASFTKPRDLQS